MMVVLFHLQGAFARAPQLWMNESIAGVFSAGHYGVNVFFVLSGFVIAYSLRSAEFSWSYLGRFTVRRSIRLDLPLWCAIALEFVLVWISIRYFPDKVQAALPTLAQVLANAFYLQEFLGYKNVSPVFWTLCYEIQFYLALVIILVIEKKLALVVGAARAKAALWGILVALFVASLAVRMDVLTVLRGLALGRWAEFFLGVVTYWWVSGRIPQWVAAVAFVLFSTVGVSQGHSLELIVTLSSAALCAMCVLHPRVNEYANRPSALALGRISYSLYLVHGSIGYRTVSLGQHFWGASLTSITGPLLWIASLLAALLSSALFYWVIERPALALSRRIRLPGAI
jgi:peptidoglycan/LPS O-acetylase OafA/YrhL